MGPQWENTQELKDQVSALLGMAFNVKNELKETAKELRTFERKDSDGSAATAIGKHWHGGRRVSLDTQYESFTLHTRCKQLRQNHPTR